VKRLRDVFLPRLVTAFFMRSMPQAKQARELAGFT